ncbi:hypothetical protein A2U01_0071046, partial [Trifolium medium]|nr:hypothetical protein [Trifolium medium]
YAPFDDKVEDKDVVLLDYSSILSCHHETNILQAFEMQRIIFDFNVVSTSRYMHLQLLKDFRGSTVFSSRGLQNLKSSELDVFS